MSDKILIVLPFWDGDKRQASALATLMADLEPQKSKFADFAFVARHDCKQDMATVNYVSRKFSTYTVTSPRQETGWPNGCNGIFFGAVDWALRGISSAKIPRYKAIFLCASDSAPMTRDSLLYMHAAWDIVSKKGAKIAGAMVGGNCLGGNRAHINGDCTLISGDPEYLSWICRRAGDVIRRRGGWDWILAPEFEARGWANLPGVTSQWKRPSFCEAEWDGYVAGGMKWLHGVKDYSLLDVCRKRLL